MLVELLALTPQQNTLAIAIVVPIFGVLGPLLVARQVNKNNKEQKKLDWAREDEVAARAAEVAEKAAEAAQLVIERQIALDKKTDEVARIVAESTTYTNEQLQKIHGLVNSQLTQAVRSELGATRDTLALMSELIANHRKNGIEPSIEVLAAYKGRESKIFELEENLKVREAADEVASNISSKPQEVVVVNPDPVPVIDTKEQ